MLVATTTVTGDDKGCGATAISGGRFVLSACG
jgi:hypothetical protein